MANNQSKLWGGRFSKSTNEAVEKFAHSLPVDTRLCRHDLLGCIAHAQMLGTTGIILKGDAAKLVKGLKSILNDFDAGKFEPDPGAEDIHTGIQDALQERVGDVALKLHSGRSRNDQVVTAFRLWAREANAMVCLHVQQLQQTILAQAENNVDVVMPGYTHLQHAQPVLASHVFLSYLNMLERDVERFQAADKRINILPLGSAALAGTGLPIDRKQVAHTLGFKAVNDNSLDGVTDRDFVLEFLSNLSILSTHLSRIAEDLLLWCTHEFGFVRFDESLLMGSSMMPQKQNPDFLELVRGSAPKVIGNLMGALTLVKALSTGYQRDLQNDKELLFEATDKMEGMLTVMVLGFKGIQFNRERLAEVTQDEALFATDLAEYLVTKGVAFTMAHKAVGQLLTTAHKQGVALKDLPLETFKKQASEFEADVFKCLDATAAVKCKQSFGSTNPTQVKRAIKRWKKVLAS